MRCTFTNRTIGMTSFSIGTNRTIGTNGPSVWRIVSVCVYWTWVFGHTEHTATILLLLVLHHQILFGGKALKALESLQWVPYAQMSMSNIHNFPVHICQKQYSSNQSSLTLILCISFFMSPPISRTIFSVFRLVFCVISFTFT